MPFAPGQSGNPAGRPKENAAVKGLARTHSVRAIERLVELMNGDDPRVAVSASQAILDRAYGKPAQAVTVAGDEEGGPIHMVHEVALVAIDATEGRTATQDS